MARENLFAGPASLDDDTVYRRLIESRDALDEKLTEMTDAKERKRRLEIDLDALEYDVLARERGRHPELSATAMDKHHKSVLHEDPNWKRIRNEIADTDADLDDLLADKSILTRDIEIGCARLYSLAGKYAFLGSTMSVESSASAPKVEVIAEGSPAL